MYTVKIIINKSFKKAEISPFLYGSFVEHMGRVVYSGIYEPTHPLADQDGFRSDVIEKVKEMGVTCIRYPGGNFVSCYDWRDGVGPKESRPRRREIAWKSIETNEFGTDEFMKWLSKCGLTPILAVNLGTKGIENAVSLLEYCNLPTGTAYSDYRAENGNVRPYGVPFWCLGNEMDGKWQIGYKTPEDYAKLAAQTAHAMKSLDSRIRLIVCGSSSTATATYTDWERIVLEESYEFVDYIALHQYYGGQERGTEEFLSQSIEMEEYIDTVIGICDTVKNKKGLQKKIDISFDEWGVWEIPGEEVADDVAQRNWEIAPAFSEQIYTMEDALLFSSMLMAMLKRSDRVKIACQSLLTNISAAIMTEPGGEVWLQTIYYPFSYMAKYGRGTVLFAVDEMPAYQVQKGYQVPFLDYVAIHNDAAGEVVIFAVNRMGREAGLSVELQGFETKGIVEEILLESDSLKDTNLEEHGKVVPKADVPGSLSPEGYNGRVRPFSWKMIRILVDEK
jgi:alpha-N-arabinofuranosidase